MPTPGFVVSAIFLLGATVCSALPKRRLGEFIDHFDTINYDRKDLHERHTKFSERYHAGDTGDYDFKFSFRSHGRSFHLEVHPTPDLFTDNAKFLHNHDKEFDFDRAGIVIGRVVNEPNSLVHGGIFEGRFRGVVVVDGEKFSVDPALAHFDTEQAFHSVMYKESDIQHEKLLKGSSCGNATHDEWSRHKYEQSRAFKDEIQSMYGEKSRVRRQAINVSKTECQVNIAGDHTYSALVARAEAIPITSVERVRAAVIQSLAVHIVEANNIFPNTIFQAGGKSPEGIRLAIKTARAYVNEQEMAAFRMGTGLTSSLTSANAILTDWSTADWDEFCLSILFSNRDYDDNVLGLAWVGGLCKKRRGQQTTNTNIVTARNNGRQLPGLVVSLVFIHEVGHNFGAGHDLVAACTPSDSQDGRYIMSAVANSGQLRNHRLFSTCSRTSFASTFATQGYCDSAACCLQVPKGRICGNRVKETGEECDCGNSGQCGTSHLCCSATGCKRRAGSACAIQDGPCCERNGDSCTFIASSPKKTCSDAHECRLGVGHCDGSSAVCPRATAKPDGTVCNKGRALCDRGDCNGTLCGLINATDCFCSGADSCAVCCMQNGVCSPLRNAAFNKTALTLNHIPGAPCDNYKGTCNFLTFCRRLSDSSLLFTITNALFDISTFQSAWAWAKTNWYYVLAGLIGLIAIFALIIHFCAKKTPRTVEVHRRTVRRNKARSENLELVTAGR